MKYPIEYYARSNFVQQNPRHPFMGLCSTIDQELCRAGAPPEIVAGVLIPIISLLTQGGADVLWPNGVKLPIGMSVGMVANSTFGKSLLLKILGSPIENFLAQFPVEDGASGQPDFLVEDCTSQALLKHLKNWPNVGLILEEGALFTRLLKESATVVKLIDGAPIRVGRVTSDRIALRGHRMVMLMMIQPDIFEAMKPKLGGRNGSIGLANRIFFTRANAGIANDSLAQLRLSNPVKEAYESRAEKLLDATVRNVRKGADERPALRLDFQATEFLSYITQASRRECMPGAPLASISEYVSRHAERVLRLSGAFHVFEYGAEGEISLDTIQRADQIGRWHIDAFAEMFYEPPKLSQVEVDVIELEHAIRHTFQTTGTTYFQQSMMRAHALNLGLTTARFNRALAVLGGRGKVRVVMQRRTPWVEINTFHFRY